MKRFLDSRAPRICGAVFVAIQLLTLVCMFALDLQSQTTIPGMPIVGSNYCSVEDVANTGSPTRARIQFTDISKCGITAGNPYFFVVGISNGGFYDAGNRSDVNTHPSHSTDVDGLRWCAQNISGNFVDVFKGDCVTPVANNGTYAGTNTLAMAWAVEPKVLKAGPVIMGDGIAGPVVTGIATAGWKTGPAWTALVASTDAFVAQWGPTYPPGCDYTFMHASQLLMRWYAEGKPTSGGNLVYRTAALAIIDNIEANYWPAMAYDTALSKGGHSESETMDYRSQLYSHYLTAAISWGWSEMSAPTRTKVLAFLLNDFDHRRGGHDFLGTSRNNFGWRPTTGTVTFSHGSPLVTGFGTNFSSYAAGDGIRLDDNNYAELYTIGSIASDTSLTLTVPVRDSAPVGSGRPFRVSRAWTSSDLGLIHKFKSYGYTTTCGQRMFAVGHNVCTDYAVTAAPYGQNNYGEIDFGNNHILAELTGELLLGLSTAHADIRGQWLLEATTGIMYHWLMPGLESIFTGLGAASTNGYHPGRQALDLPLVGGALRTGFTDAPDYVRVGMIQKLVRWTFAQHVPGRFQLMKSQADAFRNQEVYNIAPAFAAAIHYPEIPEVAEVLGSIPNLMVATYNTATINNTNPGRVLSFPGTRADITPTTRTNTTLLFDKAEHAACLAQRPSVHCTDRVRTNVVSATGFTPTSRVFFADYIGSDIGDSGFQVPENGLYAFANGRAFMENDGTALGAETTWGNNAENYGEVFFTGVTHKLASGNGAKSFTTVERMGGNQFWAAFRANIEGHYQTSTGLAQRAFLDAKRSGQGFVLERVKTANPARVKYHYALSNDCGTPTATGCVTFSSASGTLTHQPPSAGKIMTRFVSGTPAAAGGSDTNGSYAGGFGRTFAVNVTGTDITTLHRVTTSTGEAFPSWNRITSGTWDGVQVEGSEPKVMLISMTDSNSLSWNVTATGSVQQVLLGVTPGSVAVTRNGSPIIGSPFTIGSDGVLEFVDVAGVYAMGSGGGGGAGGSSAGTTTRGAVGRGAVIR